MAGLEVAELKGMTMSLTEDLPRPDRAEPLRIYRCGEAGFTDFGWRIPFLLSFVLLAVSLYIRVQMRESPLFAAIACAALTTRFRIT